MTGVPWEGVRGELEEVVSATAAASHPAGFGCRKQPEKGSEAAGADVGVDPEEGAEAGPGAKQQVGPDVTHTQEFPNGIRLVRNRFRFQWPHITLSSNRRSYQ